MSDKIYTDAGAERPDYDNGTHTGWQDLAAQSRAQLLLQGIPFPSETPSEMRCRLKRDLQLYDDDDLCALLDKSADTLARMRVEGTGNTSGTDTKAHSKHSKADQGRSRCNFPRKTQHIIWRFAEGDGKKRAANGK